MLSLSSHRLMPCTCISPASLGTQLLVVVQIYPMVKLPCWWWLQVLARPAVVTRPLAPWETWTSVGNPGEAWQPPWAPGYVKNINNGLAWKTLPLYEKEGIYGSRYFKHVLVRPMQLSSMLPIAGVIVVPSGGAPQCGTQVPTYTVCRMCVGVCLQEPAELLMTG